MSAKLKREKVAKRERQPNAKGSIVDITEPAILRLARAGVRRLQEVLAASRVMGGGVTMRLSKLTYDEVRGEINAFARKVIKHVVRSTTYHGMTQKRRTGNTGTGGAAYTSHARRSTVLAQDVREALQHIGHKKYATFRDAAGRKPCGQGESPPGCYILPRAPLERLFKEVSRDLAGGLVRWEADAVANLQAALEAYMTDLFDMSFKCALHAKRQTILPKDIQLTLHIKNAAER